MKLLNKPAILTAYWRFVGHFVVLLAALLLVLYLFLRTLTVQVRQLTAHKINYTDVVVQQRLFGQQADSIYRHLTLLNTGLMRSDRALEERIVHENTMLYAQLEKARPRRGPHAVFYQISRGVNDILLVKDSIRSAEAKSQSLRQELSNCQLRIPSTPK